MSVLTRENSTSLEEEYQRAIAALNSLQSNAQVLEKVRKENDKFRLRNIPHTLAFLSRIGITADDLKRLSVIHVTGTKGKGSTCAITDSILRQYGFNTGFFSSPHLLEVRERIRLNGIPLTKPQFISYFWEVFTQLVATQAGTEEGMPPYFRFLTVMALKVFLEEKIDVAIMEVGIGGRFDCTNVVQDPVVCAITSLGMDHIPLLGDTIESIAWHKAGIIKPGCQAVTVPNQQSSAMAVLLQEAETQQCPLLLSSPSLDDFDEVSEEFNHQHRLRDYLGIDGAPQMTNSALALHTVHLWLQNRNKRVGERVQENLARVTRSTSPITLRPFPLTRPMVAGLSRVQWPGRFHVVERGPVTFFIDGAHTEESIALCSEWFRGRSFQINPKAKRILIFNSTGGRDPQILLRPFKTMGFDCVIFSPNVPYLQDKKGAFSADTYSNLTSTEREQMSRCEEHMQAWISSAAGDATTVNSAGNMCRVVHCVAEAVDWIEAAASKVVATQEAVPQGSIQSIHVLATGSLHLIGALLKIIQPDVIDSFVPTEIQ